MLCLLHKLSILDYIPLFAEEPPGGGGGGFRKTFVESSLSLLEVLDDVVDEDIDDDEAGMSAFIGPLLSKSLDEDLNLLEDSCSCLGGSPSPSSAMRDKYSSSILALFPPPPPDPGGPPSPGRLDLK